MLPVCQRALGFLFAPTGPLFPGDPIKPLSPFFPFRPRYPFSPLGPGGPGGPGGPVRLSSPVDLRGRDLPSEERICEFLSLRRLLVYLCKYSVADPGEGPVGSPPLFLDQTEAQRAEKNFFGDLSPPPLSKGLDDRSPLS